jgi:glycogen debranching enzyme
MRLKENNLYIVADARGQISGGDNGLYRRDTRFLSVLEWRIGGEVPTVLSTHSSEPYRFSQHATEADLGHTARLELRRKGILDGSSYVEQIRVRGFVPLEAHREWGRDLPDIRTLELRLESDFADMFEVRGLPVKAKDIQLEVVDNGLIWLYAGSDGVKRAVRVHLEPMGEVLEAPTVEVGKNAPRTFDADEHTLDGSLENGSLKNGSLKNEKSNSIGKVIRWTLENDTPLEITLTVTPIRDGHSDTGRDLESLSQDYGDWRSRAPIHLENSFVQRVFDRSLEDLRSLLFDTPQGVFPAAGIPWFVTPFGRDSIIVSLFTLPWYPQIAQGTLKYLAAHQGKVLNSKNLEAPGKIFHEQRDGEASRTGRTPFQTYYGTVDATPLWICLLGDYLEWTGDLDTVRELEPNLRAALAWMSSQDADPDQDGFIEYTPHKGGITNQVWKDSGDSTFDENGQDFSTNVAVVEVQSYAYRARKSAACIFNALGLEEEAQAHDELASKLQKQFHTAFWLEDLQTYAHALDEHKRPAKVIVSNPGHALWAGIVPDDIAPKLAETLFSSRMFSGWGVRTLAEGSVRFNPVSYHNGSVWPHDNAFIALGLARYGLFDHATKLAQAQLEAAALFPDARLSELFAGFKREMTPGTPSSPPVPYPAACHPQAWDAAAPLAYLRSVLGFEADKTGSSEHVPSGWGTLKAQVWVHGKPREVV